LLNFSVRETILIFFFLIYSIPGTVFADGHAPSTGVQDSLSKYKEFIGKTIIGRFGLRYTLDNYGIPTSITGDLSKGLTGTDVVEKSYQFFELNKDIFQIANPRKEFIVREVINEGMSTVKFYWAINGVKVQYGGYFLHFNKNGSLYTVEGQIDPEARNINTSPVISEEQGKSIVISDMEKIKVDWPENAQTEIKTATLIIARFEGELKLVWGISVTKGYEGYGYWIDAQTGKIIESGSSIEK
jgi:Zn-dependent metalloprotease